MWGNSEARPRCGLSWHLHHRLVKQGLRPDLECEGQERSQMSGGGRGGKGLTLSNAVSHFCPAVSSWPGPEAMGRAF